MSCPSLSLLLRFGRAIVLLPQSMATGLQNTFFAAFFCIHMWFFFQVFLVFFFRFIVRKMVQYSIMIHTFLDYSTMKATKVDKHYIFKNTLIFSPWVNIYTWTVPVSPQYLYHVVRLAGWGVRPTLSATLEASNN